MRHPDWCECGSCCARGDPDMAALQQDIERQHFEQVERSYMSRPTGYAERLKREAAEYVEKFWLIIATERGCDEARARELADFEFHGSI